MHILIGRCGHLFVLISFAAALLSAYSYFRRSAAGNTDESWAKLARWSFYVHAGSVIGVIVSLFSIIYNHYYEYHYAWSHSSRNLPAYYMISCFWEGQEGSFLLWIFWHALIGLGLIFTQKNWEAPVMTIFALVQAFLCSMILGVVIGDLKIGSSPFMLMRDAMPDLPVWKMKPDFIAEDGRGLNPLLQNYWMVIHPPTLFLGFAGTLVPFAFAIAGLWKKQVNEWIRPALPWAIFTAMVLGTGILMGGYWAYETLNFGGYWNWDPVENAVYIPWLILVASIHAMISWRRSEAMLKAALLLSIMSFLLILYATFLTRSGILGNSSVHSFTDLGLSGQLLIYLLTFVILAVALLWARWKYLPSSEKEVSVWSREFWIFIGVIVLSLASFQVLVTTSIPVYNAVAGLFGYKSNLAPPADPIKHYSDWQMGFSVAICFLSACGQYIYWKKMQAGQLFKALSTPLAVTLLISTAIILAVKMDNPAYIALLVMSIFSLIANGLIFLSLMRSNVKLSGGAIAHIGVALMLIGILFSAAYSKVVSVNSSGLIYRKEFSTEMNRDNVLLWRSTPLKMGEYTLTYKGNCAEVSGFPTFVKKEFLAHTQDPYRAVALGELSHNNKIYFKKGDTVRVQPENTFYAVEFKKTDAKPDDSSGTFMMYPRAQVNPNMGLLASPDIRHFAQADLYTHVSSIPPEDEEREWKEQPEITAAINDTFFVNDFVAQLISVNRMEKIEGLDLGPGDAAVKAQIRIFGTDQNYIAEPIFVIKNNQVGAVPATLTELGLRMTLLNIDPKTGKFTFGVSTTKKDWIILKAIQKPYINVLWTGAILMVLGFAMAGTRRLREYRLTRNREV
ncbi:MAG: cytochrome c biogenesis protein CcsA [Bacteroidota bacterium]